MAAKKKNPKKRTGAKLTREEKKAKFEKALETYNVDPAKPKRDWGRPTEYEPAHCDLVFEMLSKGKSLAAFCTELGIGRTSVQQWEAKYPDFKVACDAAREAAQLWWENLGGTVASGAHASHKVFKNANYGMIQFMMSRRFADYYAKNRMSIEKHSGPKDDPLGALNKEERRELIQKYKLILEELERDDGEE